MKYCSSLLCGMALLACAVDMQEGEAVDGQAMGASGSCFSPTSPELEVFPLLDSEKFRDPTAQYHLGAYANTNESDFLEGGHLGNDIVAPTGTQVVAPVSGTIVFVRSDSEAENGLGIVIRRGNINFYGTHFESLSDSLRVGARIEAGTPMATLGNSGVPSGFSHVHFSIFQGETTPFYPFRGYVEGAMDPFPHLMASVLDGALSCKKNSFSEITSGSCGGHTVEASWWSAADRQCSHSENSSCSGDKEFRCAWNADENGPFVERCVENEWSVVSTRVSDEQVCDACNNSGWYSVCMPPVD